MYESSTYFQNILSYRFKDHKNEYVEVNSPTSYEVFEKAMEFVNNGELDLNDEHFSETFGISILFESNFGLELTDDNIFATFELADYLQMDMLKNWCLDQFTSSLTRDNVQRKFNMLESLDFPVCEFKQRALNFIENISCGMYFMQV